MSFCPAKSLNNPTTKLFIMDAEDRAGILTVQELMELYTPVKGQIEARLGEFRNIWETASDEDLFRELVFCLLTPQSKAKNLLESGAATGQEVHDGRGDALRKFRRSWWVSGSTRERQSTFVWLD